MTAIIGILNKSAVAISADSAVTVGGMGNSKIYNNANKIFNLQIGKPIGIMIYNSAEFGGVPWETIIKQYRIKPNLSGFNHTSQYRDDFIQFLVSFQKKYKINNEEETIADVTIRTLNFIEDELNETLSLANKDDKKAGSDNKSYCSKELKRIIKSYLVSAKKNESIVSLEGLNFADFSKKYGKTINEITIQFLEIFSLEKHTSFFKKIIELVYECITHDIFLEQWTGLVFTGFGDEDLFPSLYSVKIGGIISGKIRWANDADSIIINNKNHGAIAPFAQTDIMRTFVEGIDPYVRDSIPPTFESVLNEFKKFILENLDFSSTKEKNLEKILEKNIPKITELLVSRLEDLRSESHIVPMLSTIHSLSKEDLTEMAESLINLTYLKRRASFGEESVGGPVDSAVITKGDGFIWIKRKHYFKPELNLNYLNKSRIA